MSHYRLGAAFLSATLIVGGFYFYEPPKAPPKDIETKATESESPLGVGIIDVEQIKIQHPDYETLSELQGRQTRLKLELEEVMKPVFAPNLPEIDTKPFEDSLCRSLSPSKRTQSHSPRRSPP